jgi:hypothetical protein
VQAGFLARPRVPGVSYEFWTSPLRSETSRDSHAREPGKLCFRGGAVQAMRHRVFGSATERKRVRRDCRCASLGRAEHGRMRSTSSRAVYTRTDGTSRRAKLTVNRKARLHGGLCVCEKIIGSESQPFSAEQIWQRSLSSRCRQAALPVAAGRGLSSQRDRFPRERAGLPVRRTGSRTVQP